MRITVLAGGIGAARFLRGLLAAVPDAEITVIGNTGDDITLYGLRVCPDLDSVMYTLGGGNDEAQGWGRADETWTALSEVTAYRSAVPDQGADPPDPRSDRAPRPGSATTVPGAAVAEVPSWFGLGDRDLGTHLVRTAMLDQGHPLSAVTATLGVRWQLPVRMIPMTDERVETHVYVEDPAAPNERRRLHFQEYWVRHHAGLPVVGLEVEGIEAATPAPGVLAAIADADLIVFPPSNPVVSIGPILAVPGVSEAVRSASAPVIGVSPIIGGAPVRGMADKLLPAIGVDTSAAGVALHFGARGRTGAPAGAEASDAVPGSAGAAGTGAGQATASGGASGRAGGGAEASGGDAAKPAGAGLGGGGLLDGWLVDSQDAQAVPHLTEQGLLARSVPLLMSDPEATEQIANAVLDLARQAR